MSDAFVKRIGELLIESQLISPANLEEALEYQKLEYKPLGKILVEMNYITQEDLDSVLKKHLITIYVNPRTFTVRNPELLVKIPKDIAYKWNCIPYDIIGDEMSVVMENPYNIDALIELHEVSQMRIRPLRADSIAISEVLNRIYDKQEKNDATLNEETSQEIAADTEALTPISFNVTPELPSLNENDAFKDLFKNLGLDSSDNAINDILSSTISEDFELPPISDNDTNISDEKDVNTKEDNETEDTITNNINIDIPEITLENNPISAEEHQVSSEEETETQRPWSIVPQEQIAFGEDSVKKHESKLPISYLTFDNFVVAPSNQLAWAAAQNVVAQPGVGFNPLFIYGGVGLGKTHLSNAIGNALAKKYPKAKISYISIDTFVRELIDAVEHGDLKNFRARYRNLDLLLVDDVQFLSGQERTQEEFFYVFEQLYRSNGQMVITSDRLPRQIDKLEDRLRSRFEGGLLVDVQIPDLETRIAIFRKKIAARGMEVDDNVARLVATRLASNIRELEGVANRILAQCQLMQEPISAEMVQQILETVAPTETIQKQPTNPVITKPGSLPSEGFR